VSTLSGRTAVVGVGATDYYRRGQSWPRTQTEMACDAIIAACDDAGLDVTEIDGFALFATGTVDPADMVGQLGIPEIRFAATLSGGGSGSAGCVGLAAAAIAGGIANVVVSVLSLQQRTHRIGGTTPIAAPGPGAAYGGGGGVNAERAFSAPAGLSSPGQNLSLIAQRHMHRYGTTREHFAEVCISQRNNARTRPRALFREPLTLDDYFAARMISDPLCLYDYTMESDGAVAVVTTSIERARDLEQPPAVIQGTAMGGTWDSHKLIGWYQQPDDAFTSAGHQSVARSAYEMADVGPGDIDVALFYDHFSPLVIMQLEDYGFCAPGEGGPFVAEGNIRWPSGRLPVNTHGGHLSEAYIIGMTHVMEAVEQVRGSAVNQVEACELALATGGPSHLPVSATIFGVDR
jgi:acetyl-CoA acetyltransferase